MTDAELMLLDAEYWGGGMTALEYSETLLQATPRLCWLESEYGVNRDADSNYVDDGRPFSMDKHNTRCFFSLLIVADLDATVLRDATFDYEMACGLKFDCLEIE